MFRIFLLLLTFSAIAEATPVQDVTEALNAVIGNAFEDCGIKVNLAVQEYELKDNHIANFGFAFDIGHSLIELKGNLRFRHPVLGNSFEGLNKEVVGVGKLELRSQLIPLSMDRWEHLQGVFNQFKRTDLSLESHIIKKNSQGLVEAFSIIGKNPSDSFTTKMTVTLKENSADIDISILDPAGTHFILSQEDEQTYMEFFENLRKKDPATIQKLQFALPFVRTYISLICGMLKEQNSEDAFERHIPENEADQILSFLSDNGIQATKSKHQQGTDIDIVDKKNEQKAHSLVYEEIIKRAEFAPNLLKRYLEGLSEELAATIAKIDGVMKADVKIAFFEGNLKKPSASVYVEHKGMVKDLEIKLKRIIAASVDGLTLEQVHVVSKKV